MPKVYVGNLASSVTSRDLLAHFSSAGGAISALAITDKLSGLCRGFGFVEMEQHSDIAVAFTLLNNSMLNGQKIRSSLTRWQRTADRETEWPNNRATNLVAIHRYVAGVISVVSVSNCLAIAGDRPRMNGTIRDKAYQAYLEFLETAEKKRRWSIFDDVPWDALIASKPSERKAQSVEIFCAEELYVPDYSSRGLELVRARFGLAWFQLCWAFEESKHGLVLREYLTRSGLRSNTQFEASRRAFSRSAGIFLFDTARKMACYGALQEGATYVAYRVQRERARYIGDKVLEAIFHFVGRDEAAHAGFYRAMIELETGRGSRRYRHRLERRSLGALQDARRRIIPNYRERLQATQAGISPRMFIERVVSPLLATLQIDRHEMKQAREQGSANQSRGRGLIPGFHNHFVRAGELFGS